MSMMTGWKGRRDMYYTTIEAIARKYDKTVREYSFCPSTAKEHEKWREMAAERLMEIAGTDQCEQVDLQPCKHWEKQMNGFRKEYWTIQTEEDIIMPFYLLRPENPNGATVIVPHGHGGSKEESVEGFSRELVLAGYLVACPDERGSGERREAKQQGEGELEKRSNSHRELQQVAISFGQSVIGLAVWDLMKLVDFLRELPEIDKERIGCVGMSGGGQQTLWLSAIDTRIKVAVTSGYFYGMKESLLILCGNCACNYIPNMWKTMDMGDMGAMIAPRALFIESGEQDPLNGASGLENVYPQVEIARSAFRIYGAEEKLCHSVHPGGHQWVGTGVLEFLNKWL